MITNASAFRNHPLANLLNDCITADTGGSTTDRLCKAFKVEGWSHQFGGWDASGLSVEKLNWENDDVLRQLVAIYA